MERLSVAQCRGLIAQQDGEPLGDEEIVGLRDTLYSLADVIADAFVDLENIDQRAFEPPGDVIDVLEEMMADDIRRTTGGGVPVQREMER
jgi:hypothetical protein